MSNILLRSVGIKHVSEDFEVKFKLKKNIVCLMSLPLKLDELMFLSYGSNQADNFLREPNKGRPLFFSLSKFTLSLSLILFHILAVCKYKLSHVFSYLTPSRTVALWVYYYQCRFKIRLPKDLHYLRNKEKYKKFYLIWMLGSNFHTLHTQLWMLMLRFQLVLSFYFYNETLYFY